MSAPTLFEALPPQLANIAGEQPQPLDLNQQTVIVCLTLHAPSRKVKAKGVEVRKAASERNSDDRPADPEAVTVSKEIMDAPEFDAVGKRLAQARQWLQARALPSKLLKNGLYRLPIDLVETTEAYLSDSLAEVGGLLDKLIIAYPELIEQRRSVLRELFDADDYPPAEQLRAAFGLEWSYITIGAPEDQLRRVSRALAKREADRAAENIRSEGEAIRDALREEFAGLVSHMAERLQPGEDGKPRIFRDSLVENMSGWLDVFQARNVTGDADLGALADRARNILAGVKAQDIRDNKNQFRQNLAAQFEGIKATIEQLVITKPTRRIVADASQEV